MKGRQQTKKPTYKDIQLEIGQLAQFMQRISHVVLQLDGEIAGLKNELIKKEIIDKPVEKEAEEAKVEDYFPAKSGAAEASEIKIASASDEETSGQVEISSAKPEAGLV